MATEKVHVLPILSDNYAYVIDGGDGSAACVDPADAKAVLKFAQSKGLRLTHVLTTHSHWDHAGGNSELRKLVPGIEVIGGKGDGVDAVTREVWDGDSVQVGNIAVQVLATPCHTKGHVTYVCNLGAGPRCAFTGDTLFVAGCGHFNSGTPSQMFEALYNKISTLPDDTLLFVGHEYTVTNLKFAARAEPSNEQVRDKLAWAELQQAAGKATVPSTLSEEKATNPFLRCREESLQQFTGQADVIQCLAAIRAMKTGWRPT